MDKFTALLSFMAIVLVFKLSLIVDGSSDTTKDDGFMGILGAIVDNSSRIGKEESVATEMAVEDFNNKTNQSLVLKIRNSQGKPLHAALAARDLINTDQVQAILGPQTWEEVSLVAEVGSKSHIPIVSLGDANPKWATELWTFLVQASPNQLKQMEAIAAMVQSWEWHQVTVIYEDRDFSASAVLSHLYNALKEVSAEIIHYVALPPFASSTFSEELERLKSSQFRVFVVHLSMPLAVQLFEKAKGMNMMEKDYVWITTDPFASLVPSFNASTISSMQGIIGVKSHITENDPHFRDFHNKFRQRFSSEHTEDDNHEPSTFAAQAYDAAWTVALAMREKKQGRHKKLSDIMRRDFHGLSGEVQFTDKPIVPSHTYQIINVVGESYTELGFWSDGLGFSKTIGEGATFNSSIKDLGHVCWPGRGRDTPKGWNPPTAANPLKIGVPTRSSLKHYVNVEAVQDYLGNNISFSYKGLAIDLFKATLEKLPFHLPYEFFPFDDTMDALVEQIHLENFDAVVGNVAILAERCQHAEFTAPYTETGLVMIVPIRSRTRDAWLFIKPLTNAMWILTGATSIYNGFVIWLIEHNHCPELKGSISNQIGTMIWLAFSTFFSSSENKLSSNLSRITMVVWLFMALVITQTYTANLASLLTVPRLEPTVVDVASLQNSNAMVGCSGIPYLSEYLQEVLHFHPDNMKNFTSAKACAEALRSKEIAALFLEVSLAKLFLAEYCKSFTMAGPKYKIGGFGFAFRRGSQLLPSVSQAMLKVSESGEFRDLENRMLATQNCIDMEPDDHDETLSLSLSLSHSLIPGDFWVLFTLTGGTSSISLVIYIFQKRRFSRKVSDIAESGPGNSPNATDLQADQV